MWKRLVVLSSVAALCLACAVTRHGLVEERGNAPGAPGPAAASPATDFVLSAPAVQVASAPLGVALPPPAAAERADASCAPECHSQFARGAEGESEENEAAERRGRDEFAFYQRSYPAEGLPDGAIADGRLHFTAQRAQMSPSAVAALATWAPVGPSPIIGERHGAESLRQNCSGRATAVLIDPRNSNTVYVGAAQGGVWKTTNAGASWAPLTATAPSQATGFMTFDPTNPDIVYVGTGEPHGSDSHYGAGLLKSTNGGASWTVLGADVFSGRAISAVVVNPQNTQQLWVGLSTRVGGLVDVKPNLAKPGVYISTNGGASWSAITLCSQSNPQDCANVSSIAMDRNNPSVVYAGFDGSGVFKTTDGGSNWSAILGPAAAQSGGWDQSLGDANRVEVIVAPSNSQRVYAGIYTLRQQGVPGVLFRSDNGGQNWTVLNVQPPGYPQAVSYCGGQCSYDNVLAVHPTDPNVLAAGGAALYSNGLWDGTIFITRDGGTSFSTHTGTALDQTAHPDLHGIAFDPSNPNTIWITNDGGVYRSTNGGNSWTERNGNLSTLQFQSIAQHPTDPNVMFGGMQDNAKAKTTDGGATWVGLDAGDGGFAAIDPFDTRYWFGTRYSIKGGPMQFQRNDFSGSASADDWPVKIMDASSGVDVNDNVLFYAPLVLDPNVAGRAYWATARLYRTDNRGDSFTAISPDLTKATSRFSAISAVSVRKGDSNTIVVGTGDGKVQVTRNGGGSWSDLTKAPLPNRFVSDVFAYDSSVYYAAFSGFGANTPATPGHVYKTTDGGATWTDISRTGQAGGLPDLPVSALAVDRDQAGALYAGTDLGVYRTLNDGASWEPFSEGMPLLSIYDLDLTRYPDGTRRLAAATHGRSIYRVTLDGGGGGGGDVTAPTTPTGPAAGTAGTSYSYTTGGATCTSGGGVQYQFDWGDGTTSAWLTPTLAPGGPDEAAAAVHGTASSEPSGDAAGAPAWSAGSAALAAAGASAPAAGAPIESIAPGSEPPFSYYYQGRLVVLEPSADRVAVREKTDRGLAPPQDLAAREGWLRDPASARDALTRRGLALYRVPAAARPKDASGPAAITPSALERALALGLPAQPVFELGGATKIASDEVIVGFRGPTGLDAAQRFVAAQPAALGLLDARPLFGDLFVVRIADAAGGRAYAVARALARAPELAFAEPNHVLILHGDAATDALRLEGVAAPTAGRSRPMGGAPATGTPVATAPAADPFAAPGWTTILSDNFEGSAVQWQVDSIGGTSWIYPEYSTLRARSGSRSAYMTGWDNWNQTTLGPPYPDSVDTILKTPPLNLAGYEEAYVEYWFWAEYENPAACAGQSPALCDYGKGYVFDPATQSLAGGFIAVPFTGDLWKDVTAQNGWRRVLVRVPPPLLKNGVEFRWEFLSDASVGAGGLFIDDVRIVATANVDTEPIGNDPYGARQYELKNVGQIAGLGNDNNDLNVVEAWNEVTVSPGVVVAVIDDGVELAHPDLNLVTGYDGDTGAVGGAPRDANSNHGTACAGNVGAVRNNGIGVSGTAPGVKIMPVHNGGTEATLANAIAVAVNNGASVLSNSWGWVGAPNAAITTALQNALASGRAVLIAAGNGPDRPPWVYETAFPCNLTAQMDVVCVGASSPTDEHKSASSSDGLTSWGSSYIGAGPDVVAPGPWSYTTDRLGAVGYNDDQAKTGVDPNYEYQFGGTSSSTPKVAGIVALMLSRNPALTPAQVKSILRQTADDIGTPGDDDKTGTGRVDAQAAVLASGGGGGGNPLPVLTGISPSSATAGSLGFTLTASGSGFINGSVVRWNGADRPTSFVSTTQLTAIVAAADIATAGTAQVTVFTPAPGGGTSAAQTFTITGGGGGGGNTATASHAWTNNGAHPVKARARCASDTAKVSGDSAALTVTITGGGGGGTITTPRTPSGPAAGVPATAYEYRSGGATCSLGEASQYQFDWGDGTMSTWITPAGLAGADGSLAAGAAASFGSAMPVETAGNPRADLEQLAPLARQHGRVRVIVTLREPFAPEGLMTPASAIAQQDRIARTQDAVLARLDGEAYALHRRYRSVAALAMEADARTLERLAASPEVARIEEDRRHELFLEQSVPLIGAPAAWTAGHTGAGQAVAILDTGVERNHPFLAGKVIAEACFSTTDTAPPYPTTTACPNGQSTQTGTGAATPCNAENCDHGTHCAGIAAGKGAAFSGVAKEASIVAVQVFSVLNGGGATSYTSDDIAALDWVYQQRNSFGVPVASINMSLGGGQFKSACDGDFPAMKQAIDNLRSVGIATVIASGNNGWADSIAHPACISSGVAIGSTTKFDGISSFSNSSSLLKLLAPGSDINSSVTGGAFEEKSGTSMATPHVAGAWAVLKSKKPSATVDEVLAAFTSTGLSITDGRNGLARPRIRVDQAAAALSGGGGGGGGDAVAQHGWAAGGSFQVKVRARCAVTQGVVSDWSVPLTVSITQAAETVSAPTALSGPLTGEPGQSLTYTTGGATSSQGNPVQYEFDWLDGTTSGWLPAGTTTASHAWSAAGTWGVRTRARSATNTAIESGWSATLPVSIRLTTGPDLVGSWSGAKQTCKTKKGVTNCTITGKYTVTNNGTVNSGSTQAWVILSTDNALSEDDALIKTFSVTPLKPRAKKALKLSFKVPTGYTAAGLYLLAYVDPSNTVAETNESNNLANGGVMR